HPHYDPPLRPATSTTRFPYTTLFRSTHALDDLGEAAEVSEVAGLDLSLDLALGPHHEQIRRGVASGLQGVGDQGALQILVLEGLDGDLHARVGVLELRGHLLPEGLERLTGAVVPPRDRDFLARRGRGVAAPTAGAGGEGSDRDPRGGHAGGDARDAASVHL